MLSQKHSGQELLLLIRRSMREAELDAVYHTLSKLSLPQAEEILLRCKIELERFHSGEIDAETWCQHQMRSFDEILKWPEFQQSQETSQGVLDKKLLARFVNTFELDKALKLCEVLGDSSILLQARFNLFEKMYNQGIVEMETMELIRHSTQHQLWELSQTNAPSLNFILRSFQIISKWFRGLFN